MRQARFTVSLDKASDEAVSVRYATANDTAVAPTDYTAKTGTLTFAPGETTKDILVMVRDMLPNSGATAFKVNLSQPVGATLLPGASGTVTIPGDPNAMPSNLERFNWSYNTLKDVNNGFFGPTTGPNAFKVPYHARERSIIVEAPDWTHESVSETASYHVKLEGWKAIISGDTTGLVAAWDAIEKVWIPDTAKGQPWGAFDPEAPAGFAPDAATLEATPVAASNAATVGRDPLYAGLLAAYGTKSVYLMHWLIDVEGDYGFHNPDGSTKNVFINNYQRGPVEDGLATITHACYDDFQNGGHPQYGMQPIYGRSKDLYPDGDNNSYSKQWNYSMAGDADVRAVGSSYWTLKHMSTGVFPAAITAKSKKMADYIRYTLFDKYFHAIPGQSGEGCHYLLSWGCGFGGGIPNNPGETAPWGFRIGNSEIHHGYNGIDVAYAAMTGKEFAPGASGAPAMWAISLDRQIEMVRWLQSPEGPIAGGVTSNWRGSYGTPADGRATAKFYGLYYNYSPSWFNPPSNNWTGFQAWGLERLAALYTEVAGKSDSVSTSLAFRMEVILAKFVAWFYNHCTVDVAAGTMSYPINSRWTSDTVINGVTSTVPTPMHGDYEYLPTLNWDGTGSYENFWKADGSVPNPNLHCVITESGWDPGTAGGFAQVLIQYAYANKVKSGGLTGSVPNTAITFAQVLKLAQDMMDVVWKNKSPYGFGSPQLLNIPRLRDKLWIPPEFGTGHMPHGEVMKNNETTFESLRATMYHSVPEWPAVEAYLNGTGDAPTVTLHRFWNGVDCAAAYAMLAKFFPAT